MKSQIFVFTKKSAYMQRIADLVRTGHRWYVTGVVPLDKVGSLHRKFDRLYDVEIGKLKASLARKKGFASARLLFLHLEGEDRVHWVLLRTEGRLVVDGTEKLESWRDALERPQRVTLTGYELVRLTKATSDHPVWTWRYTREREAELRERLIGAIRRRDDLTVQQMIHSIWRTPGFAGAREQVKKMGQLVRAEWKRSRGKDALPEIPARVGYVRRMADVGGFWSETKGGSDGGHIEGTRKKRNGSILGAARGAGAAGRRAGAGAGAGDHGGD